MTTWLLGLVLLIAVALRLWRLDVGLPNYPSPDEPTLIGLAVRIGAGDPNPHFFSYGTLWPYTLTAALGALYVIGRALGWYPSLARFETAYFVDPTSLFMVGRLLAVALGVGTVGVVYVLGRRLASARVGLLAAATLALAPLHIEYSRLLLTDAPVTFALTVCLWLILRHEEAGAATRPWVPALATGLAISVKYTAAALILPLLVATWLRGRPLSTARRARGILVGMAGVVAGFLLGTPFALIDAPTFLGDVYARYAWARGGFHDFAPDINGFTVYLLDVLPRGVGPLVVVLGVVGLGLFAADYVRRGRAGGLLLFLFAIPYGVVIGVSTTPFDRYALPLLPILCVAAAVAAESLATMISRNAAWSLAGIVAAMLLVPAVAAVGMVLDVAKADTRDLAARWIAAHVPPGTVLAIEVYGPEVPTSAEQLRARIGRLEAMDSGQREVGRQLARWRRKYAALASAAMTTPAYVVYTLVIGSRIPDAAEIPYSVARLEALDVRYAVLTSAMWQRFTRFPERFPEQVRFYSELTRRARTVFEISEAEPGSALAWVKALGLGEGWCRRYRGPAVRIVDLRPPP